MGSATDAEELTGCATTTARSNWSSKRYGWNFTASEGFEDCPEGYVVRPQLAHKPTSRIRAGFRKCYFRTAEIRMNSVTQRRDQRGLGGSAPFRPRFGFSYMSCTRAAATTPAAL